MPQLDLFSLFNQLFYGTIYFILFYYVISLYLIPSVFSTLFARKSLFESKNDDLQTFVVMLLIALVFLCLQYEGLLSADRDIVIEGYKAVEVAETVAFVACSFEFDGCSNFFIA